MPESVALLSADFAKGRMSYNYPQDVDVPSNVPVASSRAGHTIRFSSPMPWILAIVLSLAIWAAIGWSVWRYMHG